MVIPVHIQISPEEFQNETILTRYLADAGEIRKDFKYRIRKKSIDARRKPVKFQVYADLFVDEEIPERTFEFDFQDVSKSSDVVHIVGAGPAGLFAALQALEEGIKPIVYERGKPVKERRFDLAKITKEQVVNPESNYCFGEGGAGTYSDGKLYTRSKKKGSVKKVLELLVFFGADENILVESHPHIGTNKLPKIIENIREFIIEKGGEVQFESKLTDLTYQNGTIESIEINGNKRVEVDSLVLATGHSARDIFHLLNDKEIEIEFKPFALGVRIEHSQQLIDSIQYKCKDRGEFLPPSSYSLVHNTGERGVYSFCMCPGGIIAPCATENGEVVTNGWSPSKRNNPYSNSGIVTEVRWEDIPEFHQYGALAGMYFQSSVEKACWESAGKTQQVPAQRLIDFLEGKISKDLPKTSYFPGVVSRDLNKILPSFIVDALREGFKAFGKKMGGYLTNDAVIHGTESRTSSPVRIPRDKNTLQHPSVKGMFPCAEGAGYAGGIVSAAIDGQNVVSKIKLHLD